VILLLGCTVTLYVLVFKDFRYIRTVRLRNIRISWVGRGGGHTASLGFMFIIVITR